MSSYANANSVKPRKAYSWLIVETVIVAVIVGVSKVPSPWAALLILTPIAFFVCERLGEIAHDISAMRLLFETVVDSFAAVRMDKEHGFNFVMDMVAEKLHEELTKH